MALDRTSNVSPSRRVYGAGVMAIGALGLASGLFDPGQPVPKTFSGHTVLAYAAAIFLIAAGAAIEWRRTAAAAAAILTAYYTLIVVVLMNGRYVLAHPAVFANYSGEAEQLAIAAGALIVYAGSARIDAALAVRLTHLGQYTFAVCALFFGGAHFFYMALTAPLVPHWLPPSQLFWGYATGIGHVAGGVAILMGLRARLAALLLAAMYAVFIALVHVPALLADPSSHAVWSEAIETFVLSGVAWLVADSLKTNRPAVP